MGRSRPGNLRCDRGEVMGDIKQEPVKEICPACKGQGSLHPYIISPPVCGLCRGSGEIEIKGNDANA